MQPAELWVHHSSMMYTCYAKG